MKAILEIVKFDVVDVITASNELGENETPEIKVCANARQQVIA